jgi:Domain of unknown function (DUF4266)
VRRSARSGPAALLALGTALLLGGCSSFSVPTVEPWVKPYERERLADPIMQFSRSALPDRHTTHVREVREGSRGATGVQGGGCGCN